MLYITLAIDGLKFKLCNPRDADQNLSKVSNVFHALCIIVKTTWFEEFYLIHYEAYCYFVGALPHP